MPECLLERVRNHAKAHKFSQVQEELTVQLFALEPTFTFLYGVETIMAMSHKCHDDVTREGLRLCIRQRGLKVNLDILYDEGADYYMMICYKLTHDGLDVATVFNVQDLCFDQLHENIREAIRKAEAYRTPNRNRFDMTGDENPNAVL